MSAGNMLDINTAIIALVMAIIIGFTGLVATIFAILKWYLPALFKHRDEQRKIENDDLEQRLENKNAATAADIERELMFPEMMKNNQRLVESMLLSNQANTAATIQRIEQDKQSAAVLEANTKQLTTASERLDETTDKLEAVERKVDRLHDRLTKVFPRDKSIDELFGELKAVVATTKQVVDERKGDSKPIPAFTGDITLHTAETPPPTLPDVLKPTG